jgi:dethiobiotin synthetase
MKLFIAGTDTDAGKTYIAAGLLRLFNQAGLKTIGIKPIASGCDEEGKNADACALQKAASVSLDYEVVNPYAFTPAIAPHIAAMRENREISMQEVAEKIQVACQIPADIYLIEGAGGWYTPINFQETLADLVKMLNIPVILVVNIRLGCINHAILTARSIINDGTTMLGWVANLASLAHYPELSEVIATLKHYLPGQYFGVVHYNEQPEDKLGLVLQNMRVTR